MRYWYEGNSKSFYLDFNDPILLFHNTFSSGNYCIKLIKECKNKRRYKNY